MTFLHLHLWDFPFGKDLDGVHNYLCNSVLLCREVSFFNKGMILRLSLSSASVDILAFFTFLWLSQKMLEGWRLKGINCLLLLKRHLWFKVVLAFKTFHMLSYRDCHLSLGRWDAIKRRRRAYTYVDKEQKMQTFSLIFHQLSLIILNKSPHRCTDNCSYFHAEQYIWLT